MADGSVVIGVSLDLTSFSQSVMTLEFQIRELGARINNSMAQAFTSEGFGVAMGEAMNGVMETVSTMAESITQTMQSAAITAITAFTNAGWSTAGSQAASALSSGVSAGGSTVISAANSVASSAAAAFTNGNWSSLGHNIMSGVASGVRSAGAEVISAIREVAEEANAALKAYYKISSPSALMRDEVGVMISRGIAEGILAGSGYVGNAMSAVAGGTEVGRMTAVSQQSVGKSVTQNIYLRDDTYSPYRTARRIRRESEAIFRL